MKRRTFIVKAGALFSLPLIITEIKQPILTPGNASLAVILLLFNSFISLAYMGTFN